MTSQTPTIDLSLVNIGSEETPLVILFNRLPNGDLAADIKGRMNTQELIDHLRGIADHIEQNGAKQATKTSATDDL